MDCMYMINPTEKDFRIFKICNEHVNQFKAVGSFPLLYTNDCVDICYEHSLADMAVLSSVTFVMTFIL